MQTVISGLDDLGRVERTYVCHKSTRESQRTSILRKHRPERTIWLFPHGECRMRCCDLLRDLVEKPMFSSSLSIGSLKGDQNTGAVQVRG
jgi:hypothetical protein